MSASRSGISEIEWGDTGPARSEVERLTIGPTGFLRAPAMIAEDLLIVGFSEELYHTLLE